MSRCECLKDSTVEVDRWHCPDGSRDFRLVIVCGLVQIEELAGTIRFDKREVWRRASLDDPEVTGEFLRRTAWRQVRLLDLRAKAQETAQEKAFALKAAHIAEALREAV